MLKKILGAMMGAALAAASAMVPAEPMSKEQGDALLKELHEIKEMLAAMQKAGPAPVAPQVVTVNLGGQAALGSPNAPLTLVAFTDFQCPFCMRFENETFPALKKAYIDTGKLRLVVRDMPLDFHPNALRAAQSMHCAGDQGKYWEMKDQVFKHQNKIDVDSLQAYATGIGLDRDAFKNCMASDKHIQEINESARYAASLGIRGTPSFVLGHAADNKVGGKVITGALPSAAFEAAIDDMLQRRQ